MKHLFYVLLIVFSYQIVNAQTNDDPNKTKITLSGFVSVSAFAQDQEFKFGNGQNANWVNTEYDTKKFIKSVDIRNTRLTCNIKTKEILKDVKSSVLLETDLFGGFNGNSAFSPSQQYFRLRLAYIELEYKNLKARLGQAWSPLFGNATISLSHIAFPLGYGSAGFIGWRYPGLYLYYTLNPDKDLKFRLDGALYAGTWNEPTATPDFLSPGEIGFPQAEIRFNALFGKSNLYVVAHIDRKDLEQFNSDEINKLDGNAIELGGKYSNLGFIIQGNYYFGENMGHQFAALTQLQSVAKDLKSHGGWIQLGYQSNKGIGIFGFYGMDMVDYDQAKDIFVDPRLNHQLINLMLKYDIGNFSIGGEYLNSNLISGQDENKKQGNQYSISALFKF